VDARPVDEGDVLGRPVITAEELDVVLLKPDRLLDRAVLGPRDPLREEPLPLRIGELDPVQRLELDPQVGDQLRLAGERQVLVGLLTEDW
jgi:hypothetical protein